MNSIISWLTILLLLTSTISGLKVLSSTASDFSVNITMSSNTVEKLKKSSFQLYVFKAVKASGTGGVPLVWLATNNYSKNTTVDWSENYQAYISSQINPSPDEMIKSCLSRESMNDKFAIKSYTKDNRFAITSCSSESIELGQEMAVDIYGNTSKTITNKNDGVISIVNKTNNQWTCGISQSLLHPLAFNPLSAFPLYGNSQRVITPLNIVLLMFASDSLTSDPLTTGAVVTQSWGPSILVDLTKVKSHKVTYDIDNGWGPTNQDWAKVIFANSDLTPILIQ
jgi:hypothetical protein